MDESFNQLVRGGIAPRRARRLLREFTEHGDDIVSERRQLGDSEPAAQAAARERLGLLEDFVARTLARPELQSFSTRRPWAAYAVLPLLGFAALFVATIAAVYLLADACKHAGLWNASSLGSQRLAGAATLLILWITPWAASVSVVVLAIRRRHAGIWPVVGIVLVGFLASLTNFHISLPSGHEDGEISGGIGITSDLAKLASIAAYTAARSLPVLALLLWLRARRLTHPTA